MPGRVVIGGFAPAGLDAKIEEAPQAIAVARAQGAVLLLKLALEAPLRGPSLSRCPRRHASLSLERDQPACGVATPRPPNTSNPYERLSLATLGYWIAQRQLSASGSP